MNGDFDRYLIPDSIERFEDDMFVSYLHVFYKIAKNKLKEIFIQANSYTDFKKRLREENAHLYEDIEKNADFSHPPTGALSDVNNVRRILGFAELE